MGQTVGGGTEYDPLGQTSTTTSDDHHVRTTRLTYGQETVHRVTQLLDRLVVDALEVEVFLHFGEDLLLTLDESGGQGLGAGRGATDAPPAFRSSHHRHQLEMGVPMSGYGRTVLGGARTPL